MEIAKKNVLNKLLVILWVLFMTINCSKDEKINKIDPEIFWENPDDIVYGTLLSEVQLNAHSDIPGDFIYSPPIGTKLKVGLHRILSVEFIPDDDISYNTVIKEVNIKVTGPDSVIDIDGNIYQSVMIGKQVWLRDNLKTTRLNDGTRMEFYQFWNNSSSPAYFWYNGDSIDNKTKYGGLYNFFAVITDKLCPCGWKVPSYEDWLELENLLIATGYNYDGSLSENKIAKALAADFGWLESDTPGAVGNNDFPEIRNKTGFTALPGGRITGSGYMALGASANWWTSTSSAENTAEAIKIGNWDVTTTHFVFGNAVGFSVRCILIQD